MTNQADGYGLCSGFPGIGGRAGVFGLIAFVGGRCVPRHAAFRQFPALLYRLNALIPSDNHILRVT